MTSFSRPSPGKVTVSHRSSWGVSGHRKSEGGHWTLISPIPARALPKHSHGPLRIPARCDHEWDVLPGVTVPGAVGAWGLCPSRCLGAFPGARLGGGWTGTSASATSCCPNSYTCLPPGILCSPSSPSPGVSPITPESPENGLLLLQKEQPPSSAELTSPKGQGDKNMWPAPLSLLCSASFPSVRAWQ